MGEKQTDSINRRENTKMFLHNVGKGKYDPPRQTEPGTPLKFKEKKKINPRGRETVATHALL